MENEKPRRVVWYAGCEFFRRKGPFPSEVEAWKALKLKPRASQYAHRIHIAGGYVWPEEEET